ncbi:unnamed protein product [Linum tenue]|uniref:Spt5 transcription elongation factor N-terminal domain-containing protein n=1 Tax=Linum tenue TaxID=586396 RepID=A0AAV0HDF1_9ROSI|nr:unnamed protein product [Linum tenue]
MRRRRVEEPDEIQDGEYEEEDDQLIDDGEEEYYEYMTKRGNSTRKRSRSSFIDDAAVEDNEEDDDDEDYGGGGSRSKRRNSRKKGECFFETQAVEDGDEDEDEDDEADGGDDFIDYGGLELPEEDDGRRVHQRPLHEPEDEHEIVRRLEERYSRASQRESDEEAKGTGQQGLLPCVHDAKFWRVKCVVCFYVLLCYLSDCSVFCFFHNSKEFCYILGWT